MFDKVILPNNLIFKCSKRGQEYILQFDKGESVDFYKETGPSGCSVILERNIANYSYQCRLNFDDQSEADEWIDSHYDYNRDRSNQPGDRSAFY